MLIHFMHVCINILDSLFYHTRIYGLRFALRLLQESHIIDIGVDARIVRVHCY